MKLPISDLVEDCDVSGIEFGLPDEAMNERVKAAVMGEIARRGEKKVIRLRRTLRLTLLIAAVLLLFGAIASAKGLFGVRVQTAKPDLVPGRWIVQDAQGEEQSVRLGGDFGEGLCFSFEGNTPEYEMEFHPGWLPQEPYHKPWDPEGDGWYGYLIDDREAVTDWQVHDGVQDVAIPYLINIYSGAPGRVGLLEGACEIVKTESWGALDVYEIACAKHYFTWNEQREMVPTVSYENYVFLFSRDEGYMVSVGGTLDLETLEHIARELEIRPTDKPVKVSGKLSVTLLNIGRG